MLRNGLYNLLGGGMRVVVTLVTIPLLLRVVGVEEYGLLTLVLAAINLVALAEAGLPVATTVFVARDRATNDTTGMSETLTISLVATATMATIAAAVLWIGGSGAAQLFSSLSVAQSETVADSLRIGAFVVWVRLLQQLMVGVIQAFGHYGALNLVITAQAVSANLGMVAIAWFGGRTLWLISWQALVGVLVAVAYVVLCARLLRELRPRLRWHRKRAKEIASFSGYAWGSALGGALFSQCDRLLVGGLLGLGPLGVYAAITSATTQINALSGMAVQPLMPAISALATQGEHAVDAMRIYLKRAWKTLVFVALGLGGALFVLAPLVLQLAAPEINTPQHVGQLRLAAAIYTLYSLNALGFFMLLGSGQGRSCMIVVLVSGLASLALVAAGSFWFGLSGAVVGNIGYAATLGLNVMALRGFPISIRELITWAVVPTACFAVVVALAMFARDRSGLLLALFAVYCVVLGVWFVSSQRYMLRSRLPLWAGGKAHSR